MEQTILGELGDLKNQITGFRIELMGAAGMDTKHGRLPRVEAEVDLHETRITKLEADHIRWKAYGVAVSVLSSGVGAVIALAVQAVTRLAEHH